MACMHALMAVCPSDFRCDLLHEQDKPTLPKILRDNTAIVLYKVGGEIYCSDANSTAFKFPLIDANVLEGEHALTVCCCPAASLRRPMPAC